jgi:cold shock protein
MAFDQIDALVVREIQSLMLAEVDLNAPEQQLSVYFRSVAEAAYDIALKKVQRQIEIEIDALTRERTQEAVHGREALQRLLCTMHPLRRNGGMQQGTIKRLVSDKGFGFIADDATKVEYFFHRSACVGVLFEHLSEQDKVEFSPEKGDKGPRAGQVSKL